MHYPYRPTVRQTKKIARREAHRVVNATVETGYFDARLSANPSYDGETHSITYNPAAAASITQGDNYNQYNKLTITPKYLLMYWNVTTADTTNLFTIMIIQGIGILIPAGSTMVNIFESTGNTTAPLSYPDHQYNDRFRVLYRKTFTMDTYNPTKSGKIKLKNCFAPIEFNDNAGSIESGPIYLCIISDSSASAHPAFNAQWRLYFKDA